MLAAFAGYLWCWDIHTLATCNSCSERPHWDTWFMGLTSCLVAVLRVSQVWFRSLRPRSGTCWLTGISHRTSYPNPTKDFGCHGVLCLAEQRAHSERGSSLFSLMLQARQHRTPSLQLPGFAFLAPCHILKSFLQAQGKCLDFLWESII